MNGTNVCKLSCTVCLLFVLAAALVPAPAAPVPLCPRDFTVGRLRVLGVHDAGWHGRGGAGRHDDGGGRGAHRPHAARVLVAKGVSFCLFFFGSSYLRPNGPKRRVGGE